MSNGQLPLFDAGSDPEQDVSESLASLLDRLTSRLGTDAVLGVSPIESAIPECTYKATPFQKSLPSSDKVRSLTSSLERPLRLFNTPEHISMDWPKQMSWQGRRIELRHLKGPERIESGWWSETPVRRDYFVVEAESGSRYWIFQRADDARWFLHGTFE